MISKGLTCLSLLFVITVINCDQAGPCDGYLKLVNPLPDTTVVVQDTLFIDLANPPVFESSNGLVSTYDFIELNGSRNISLNRMTNSNDGGRLTILVVAGLSIGNATVQLKAYSKCLENSTTFTVSVVDSTSN